MDLCESQWAFLSVAALVARRLWVAFWMVVALMRLNNLNAEILEFVVKPSSRVTGSIIRELDFPRSATIGGVIRDDEGIIALGGFEIRAGDRVVVCCLPEAIPKIERLFL